MAARRLVVDACVVIKWQLDDEEHVEQALALRDDFLLEGAITLEAPDLLHYELTHAIHKAARRARLPEELAGEALANLVACDIKLHPPQPGRTLELARRFNLSGYDAAYLALADRLGIEFWTADRKLHQASAELPAVRWIGDYAAVRK